MSLTVNAAARIHLCEHNGTTQSWGLCWRFRGLGSQAPERSAGNTSSRLRRSTIGNPGAQLKSRY
ncbi:hypothetical protein XELAEV_18030104mg [Xenopus laevis]|uniref:Uncharacterized protein n=1 Tax=Xenopus laevis TaxID=8355 RepID=A0A974HI95_XENLA|nr:hypothetical protein XELAEV_18030104mg [Xenopus laevis]